MFTHEAQEPGALPTTWMLRMNRDKSSSVAETTGSSYPELIAGNEVLQMLRPSKKKVRDRGHSGIQAAQLLVTSELLSRQNLQSPVMGTSLWMRSVFLPGAHRGLTPLPCPSPCHRYPHPRASVLPPLWCSLKPHSLPDAGVHHRPLRLLVGTVSPFGRSALPLIFRTSHGKDVLATQPF